MVYKIEGIFFCVNTSLTWIDITDKIWTVIQPIHIPSINSIAKPDATIESLAKLQLSSTPESIGLGFLLDYVSIPGVFTAQKPLRLTWGGVFLLGNLFFAIAFIYMGLFSSKSDSVEKVKQPKKTKTS